MKCARPKIILRIGSHAEKDYFEKLAKKLDSVMFGGNLLEITPAATCSFLFSLGKKADRGTVIPFFLDPMTYCFGPYIDTMSGKKRMDLDALKSDRLKTRGSQTRFRSIKESYRSLAENLGDCFKRAVNDGSECRAIDPCSMSSTERDKLCSGVINYQSGRISRIIEGDEFMRENLTATIAPAAIFAPYFLIHESWAESGLSAAMDLARRTVAACQGHPVHAVICASHAILNSSSHLATIIKGLSEAKVAGAWLWFDGFNEFESPLAELIAFRDLVKKLGGSMEVYNLHGGYFSLLLSHDGLTGISHGIGYGEHKLVSQVIGAAAPTVRYYLPPIRKRVGVPDVQRCLPELGIVDANGFHEKICDCTICRGVLGGGIAQYKLFGEMHRSTPTATRETQTPTAAKLCRFHFLLRRFGEAYSVIEIAPADRSRHLTDAAAAWRDCYPLRSQLGPPDDGYLERWSKALSENTPG